MSERTESKLDRQLTRGGLLFPLGFLTAQRLRLRRQILDGNRLRNETEEMNVREISAKVCGWIGKLTASNTYIADPAIPIQFVIEFLGGPLDGHREPVSRTSSAAMPDWIEVPISRSQFDQLEGIEPRSSTSPTSVAVYDLIRVAHRWRFHFRCQVPARRMRDRDQSTTSRELGEI